MRHSSKALQRRHAGTATLINNDGTRQILHTWKWLFCICFWFWTTPSWSLGISAQVQVGKFFSARTNSKSQYWWACMRSGCSLHSAQSQGSQKDLHSHKHPCFYLSAGNKSLRFLLMVCNRTFTFSLNLDWEKKYTQYLYPRLQSSFCATHDKVPFQLLCYNSSLGFCCYATSTGLTCSRSAKPEMV